MLARYDREYLNLPDEPRVVLNGIELSEGDGAAVSDEARLELRGARDAEVLLFDLA